MQLRRLTVRNFRNLADIDLRLGQSCVIVGENGVGKSNLLHALRLVLDPSLSSLDRQLSIGDFSEHLGSDPMINGQIIEISVEVEDFDADTGLLATLGGAISQGNPLRAKLTYQFRPRSVQTDRHASYEWVIFGGSVEEGGMSADLRSFIHQAHMPALRDAQGDLSSWRRSPLRPLINTLAAEVSATDLANVEVAMAQAHAVIRDLPQVVTTAQKIQEQTEQLVGAIHQLRPTLDLMPADPQRTLRALRLFLDGEAQRELSSASLGALNVLYMSLLQLNLMQKLTNEEIEYALTTIEEPEAHLHPHLQRRMFAGLLANDGPKLSTMVTTHSPHIVSVTPPQNLVVLRHTDRGADASAAREASLTDSEWQDLGRYLDATRSELVFARQVILVEGYAEQVLIPFLAGGSAILDEQGISVCAIHGTHFSSYVRFLRAIRTPHVVLTDGDPNAGAGKTGGDRILQLASLLEFDDKDAEVEGIFVGQDTLEADLFNASPSNAEAMARAAASFLTTPRGQNDRFERLMSGSGAEFTAAIDSKGRLAQRLVSQGVTLTPPSYVERALGKLGL